jgi:peptide/nickel transport system substrate-binding protein
MSEIKDLQTLFSLGQISRREFMARVSALGLAATISPVFVTAPSHASKPKKGGLLRVGTSEGQTTDSLDPTTTTNNMTNVLAFGTLRNCLVEIDADLKPVPELAESWETTPDAKKWVFRLRKGVEFHNGKTMDAKDVIYTLNRHRGEDARSPAKVILDPIVEIKADGKYTVVFVLKHGDVEFPYLLSEYHLSIVPDQTTDFEDGMGTGGYKLESFKPGVTASVVRNPNYWKPDRAHFDEIHFRVIHDMLALTNAIKTGEVDATTRCDLKTIDLLKKTKGIKIVEQKGTTHWYTPMHCRMKPFDDNNVRLALKHAVDREHVLNLVVRGYGRVGNDHPISPANRFFNKELPQRKYDPDKARFYLKKAGLSNNTFRLHTSDTAYPGAVDTAVLFKEHAAKAGINIEVVVEPADGYWSDVYCKEEWYFTYAFGRPSENWFLSTVYAEDAMWNETNWSHERFNKLLVAARSELNEDKRREMYYEMQQIIRDEGGALIHVFPSDLMATVDKLKHDKVAANMECDGLKFTERWWFGA